MHKLDEELGDILQHFGTKGMKWGVRNEERSTGRKKSTKESKSSKSSKLDKHPAVAKHGSSTIKSYRKFQAKTDAWHIDPKTGEYTHQGKAAKTARILEKVWDVAAATVVVGGVVVTSVAGA